MVRAYNPEALELKVVPGADPELICYSGAHEDERLPLHGMDCDGIVAALKARGVEQAPGREPRLNHHAYTLEVAKKERDHEEWCLCNVIRRPNLMAKSCCFPTGWYQDELSSGDI